MNPFPTTTAATDSGGWTRTIATGAFTFGSASAPLYRGPTGLMGIRETSYFGGNPAPALPAPLFLSETDPSALSGGIAKVTYSTTFEATAGKTYQFAFETMTLNSKPDRQEFALSVGGGTPLLRGKTKASGTAGATLMLGRQTWAPSFLSSTTGPTTFEFAFTLYSTSPSDDIGVSQPTVTCS